MNAVISVICNSFLYTQTYLHVAGLLKRKHRRKEDVLNFLYSWSWDPDHLKAAPTMSMAMCSLSKRRLKRPRTEKYKNCLPYYGPMTWRKVTQK